MKARISLAQIILFVSDMASAVHFYRDVLGLPVLYPAEQSDLSEEMWVELDGGACTLALHGGAEGPQGDLHQLVFRVENLEETRIKVLDAGYPIGEIRLLEDGVPVASGVDPEGHHFSIRPVNSM